MHHFQALPYVIMSPRKCTLVKHWFTCWPVQKTQKTITPENQILNTHTNCHYVNKSVSALQLTRVLTTRLQDNRWRCIGAYGHNKRHNRQCDRAVKTVQGLKFLPLHSCNITRPTVNLLYRYQWGTLSYKAWLMHVISPF